MRRFVNRPTGVAWWRANPSGLSTSKPMAKLKTVFVCQECGTNTGKWLGRCPDCDAWNSLVEEQEVKSSTGRGWSVSLSEAKKPLSYTDVPLDAAVRDSSGLAELDRVLGGGIVLGSVVLIGGDPGIGKSTLLLQVAAERAGLGRGVLYISGEESERQIKLRGERLGLVSSRLPDLVLYSETTLERILSELQRLKPSLVIVDSVQTVYSSKLSSSPGSISQIREVTAELLYYAKSTGTPVFLIGHVTKDGNLAGPKALEHMVDTVIYFEGEGHHAHRIVRAIKNRYGAAGELGVFEMTGVGLRPVDNPSGLFLSDSETRAPGAVVVCSLEGTRPLLLEIQSLVTRSNFGYPRRVALGMDSNRISLLLAVLEKRVGLSLAGEDIFVNVTGGLNISEPVADLGVVASLASSFRGQPVDRATVCIGEVGLSGEVRAAQRANLRVKEAARMGFERVLLPHANLPVEHEDDALRVIGVRNITEVMDLLFT